MAAGLPIHRVARHFAATRRAEVLALQASPLLGWWLAHTNRTPGTIEAPAILLVGSLALTAHAFVFNDWANYRSDLTDPRRAPARAGALAIDRDDIARLAALLLLVAAAAFATLGWRTFILGCVIAALSFLYSQSTWFGKVTPIAASLDHMAGGIAHFLLGYTLAHTVDIRGVLIGCVFGLVFAAGHLNQEIRDYEADRLNGIRTSAVMFGRALAFGASIMLFSAAYILLAWLAAVGMLPRLLYGGLILWAMQLGCSWLAARRGLGYGTARWLQRRYRLLFALIGLALVAG